MEATSVPPSVRHLASATKQADFHEIRYVDSSQTDFMQAFRENPLSDGHIDMRAYMNV